MGTIAAGRFASAPRLESCPKWCVVDHSADLLRFPGDRDVIHRSADTWLQPGAPGEEPWTLSAHVASPELGYHEPLLVLDVGMPLDPYAELNLDQADQFLRDLKVFTARVQQMRDQLAAMKEQQS